MAARLRGWALGTAVVVLSALAAVGGGVAIRQHVVAQEALRVAEARELALLGVASRVTEPYAAVALGAAAVKVHADDQTRTALADTMISERQAAFRGTGIVAAMAMGADGKTALVADQDLGVALWTLSPPGGPGSRLDAIRAGVLESRFGGVRAVALSADARTALIGDVDGSASLWNTTDRDHPVKTATLEGGSVRNAALTSDGKTALIGHEDGGVAVWDLTGARPVRAATLTAHRSALRSLGLSADGRIAVTVSEQGSTVWDLSDRTRPVQGGELSTAGTASAAVALTADGRTTLVGGTLWDVSDPARPQRLASLPDVEHLMVSAALTPDSGFAITAEADGRTVVWDLRDRRRPSRMAVFKAPDTRVDEVALNADGKVALIATAKSGVFSWDLTGISGDPLPDVCAGGRTALSITRTWWNDTTKGKPWPDSFGNRNSFEPCA
ncbi:WD40 repeat domain-containing protein [Nonomuraea sp. 10N515B]|uniref:WD40 repeat domain-containing protein n=1 Tax=Nonomuraea sp. 10N515B TaxID=3457422 RepID=UPI003FCC91C3